MENFAEIYKGSFNSGQNVLKKRGRCATKCYICKISFSHNSSLKTHIAMVHEGKKPFKCPICDYTVHKKGH